MSWEHGAAGRMVRAERTSIWDQALALALPQVLGTSDALRALYGVERQAVAEDGSWHYPQHDAIGPVWQWTQAAAMRGYTASRSRWPQADHGR